MSSKPRVFSSKVQTSSFEIKAFMLHPVSNLRGQSPLCPEVPGEGHSTTGSSWLHSVIQVFREVHYTRVCACVRMGLRACVCACTRARVRWEEPAVAFRSTQGAFQVLLLKGGMSSISSRCGQASGPVSRWAAGLPSEPSLSSLVLSALLQIRKKKETRGALSQARGRPCIQEGRPNSSYSQIPPDLLLFLSEN